MKSTFTRRHVLKASGALALSAALHQGAVRGAAGRGGDAGADRRGQERGQGRPLHLGRPAAGREGGEGVRGEISRHRGSRRALRRRAQLHPHRPGAVEPHLRLRRGAIIRRLALRGVEARWAAVALRPRGGGEILSAGAQGPGRAVRELPRLSLHHRHQHQSGESRGRAEELPRSARSEMGRQDRQGASGLQRHHPDRDLPDRPRCRLGLLREARQAARAAGAVGLRPAEEARARRARGDGRRHRVRHLPAQGERPAGRAGLRHRGLAADHRAERHHEERAEPERGQAVPELHAVGGVPAVQRRSRRASHRAFAGQGQSRAEADEGDQGDEGRRRRGREGCRQDQGAVRASTSRCSHAKDNHPSRHPQGLRRAGAGPVFNDESSVGRAAGRIRDAGADRGGEERGQGHLLHLGRSAARREDRQGVRGEIFRHQRPRRAKRRRARVPADRPGIRQPHPRRRRGELVRRLAFHRLEARWAAAALRHRGRGEILSARAPRRRRQLRELPHRALRHRLQHQPGEGRGRAEELRRPARSEMEGQDRQGASGLQRHHHDLDVRDGARPRLGIPGEARQAERHAAPVLGRSAEEARARRARHPGRRQRVQHLPDQGGRRPGRAGLRHRRHAAGGRARTACSRRRRTRTRRGCSRTSASRRNASSSPPMSAASAPCIRRSRRRPDGSPSRRSRP